MITAFDAIHDQADAETVLHRVRNALAPGGVFVMVDAKFSSRLEENIANPYAPMCYGISLLFCVPTSLADGGAGLGAMWGQERATAMLTDAGFTVQAVLDSPRPQNCIYVCAVSGTAGPASESRREVRDGRVVHMQAYADPADAPG